VNKFLILFFLIFLKAHLAIAEDDVCKIQPPSPLDQAHHSQFENIHVHNQNRCIDQSQDANSRCECLRAMNQTSSSQVFREQREVLTRRLALEQAVSDLDHLRRFRLANFPSYFPLPNSCIQVARPSQSPLMSACSDSQLQQFQSSDESDLPSSITNSIRDDRTLRTKLELIENNPLDLGTEQGSKTIQIFLRALTDHVRTTVEARPPGSTERLFHSLRGEISSEGFIDSFDKIFLEEYSDPTSSDHINIRSQFMSLIDTFKNPRINRQFATYLSENLELAINGVGRDSDQLTSAIDNALMNSYTYFSGFQENGSVYNLVQDESRQLEEQCQQRLDALKNLCEEPGRSQLSEVSLEHLFKNPSAARPELGYWILRCESMNQLRQNRLELSSFDDTALDQILSRVYQMDSTNPRSFLLLHPRHSVSVNDLVRLSDESLENKTVFLSRLVEEALNQPRLTNLESSRLESANQLLTTDLQRLFRDRNQERANDLATGLAIEERVEMSSSLQDHEVHSVTTMQMRQEEVDRRVAAAVESQSNISTEQVRRIAAEVKIPTRRSLTQSLRRSMLASAQPTTTPRYPTNASRIAPSGRAPASDTSLGSSAAPAYLNAPRPFNSSIVNRLGSGTLSQAEREDASNGVEDLRRYTADKEESLRNLQDAYERQRSSMTNQEKSEFENLLAEMNIQINQLKTDRELLEQRLEEELSKPAPTVQRAVADSTRTGSGGAPTSVNRPFDFGNSSNFDSPPPTSSTAQNIPRAAYQAPTGGLAGASAPIGTTASGRAQASVLGNTLSLVNLGDPSSIVRLPSNQDLQSFAQDLKSQLTDGQRQLVEVSRLVNGRDVVEVYEFIMLDGEVQYTLVNSRQETAVEVLAYEDQANANETIRTNQRVTRVAELEAVLVQRLGL
jgi:hypothetical protein